jgi:RND family efflux transporter MFP subunit
VKHPILLLIPLLAAAVLTACSGTTTPTVDASTPPAAPASAPAAPRELAVSGPIVVENQVDVLAQRDGEVATVAADTGTQVRKGQLLGTLDDRQLTAEHDAAVARMKSVEADVKNWEAEAKVQQSDLDRAQAMWDAQLITKEQLDHAKYKLVASNYEVDRERENYKNAVATARALELELEKTRITAPFDGVVARRYVRVGQRVAKNDRLFWVSAEGPLRVRFTLPQNFVGRVRAGDEYPLTLDAPDAEQHSARVLRVSPIVDPASGTIEVLADVTGGGGVIRPGMTATIHVPNPQ